MTPFTQGDGPELLHCRPSLISFSFLFSLLNGLLLVHIRHSPFVLLLMGVQRVCSQRLCGGAKLKLPLLVSGEYLLEQGRGGALPGGWGFSFILSGQAVYTSHQQHAGFWSLHTGPFYFVKLKLCLFFCHVTCLLHIALQELGVWFGCKSLVRACAVGCLFSLLMSSFNEHNSQF